MTTKTRTIKLTEKVQIRVLRVDEPRVKQYINELKEQLYTHSEIVETLKNCGYIAE